MRWNCPNCGIGLIIADAKLNENWCFARCFKCNGYSVVRASGAEKIEAGNIAVNDLCVEARAVQAPPPPPKVTKTFTPVTAPAKSRRTKFTTRTLPVAFGAAGLLAIGSGIYLYQQGQELWKKTQAQKITAPTRTMSVSSHIRPEARTEVQTQPEPLKVAAASLQISQPSQPNPMTDRIHQSAMAPTRTSEQESLNGLIVQVKAKNVSMRAGPGLQYKILAVADTGVRYNVADFSDRWFKVVLPNTDGADKKTAWIRNDLIQLVTE